MSTNESPLTILATAAAPAHRVALYESAMCCPTGVCGAAVDPALVAIGEHLRWAEGQGATVARYNLASDPGAFVANTKVSGLLQAFGDKALPVLIVDDEIASHGHYPTRDELATTLSATAEPQASSCCGPKGCC